MEYSCLPCKYKTLIKQNWTRHNDSGKHLQQQLGLKPKRKTNANLMVKIQETEMNKHFELRQENIRLQKELAEMTEKYENQFKARIANAFEIGRLNRIIYSGSPN